MKPFTITQTALHEFWRDGYTVVRNVLSKKEAEGICDCIKGDSALAAKIQSKPSADGSQSRIAVWNSMGDEICSRVGRAMAMRDAARSLFQGAQFPRAGEPYPFHGKLVDGGFAWHQDFGYWCMAEKDGFLRPDCMLTSSINLDPVDSDNGPLLIIPGTHLLGAIEHGIYQVGGQAEMNPTKLKYILANLETEPVEITGEPGDAVFFHSLVLHKSKPKSEGHRDRDRWSLLHGWNLDSNIPVGHTCGHCYPPKDGYQHWLKTEEVFTTTRETWPFNAESDFKGTRIPRPDYLPPVPS